MNVFVARKRPISLKRMIQSSFALGAAKPMELDECPGLFPHQVVVCGAGGRCGGRSILPPSVLGNGNRHLGPGRVDEAEGVPVMSVCKFQVRVYRRHFPLGPSAQNSPTMSLIGGRRPFSTHSSTSALSEKDRVSHPRCRRPRGAPRESSCPSDTGSRRWLGLASKPCKCCTCRRTPEAVI